MTVPGFTDMLTVEGSEATQMHFFTHGVEEEAADAASLSAWVFDDSQVFDAFLQEVSDDQDASEVAVNYGTDGLALQFSARLKGAATDGQLYMCLSGYGEIADSYSPLTTCVVVRHLWSPGPGAQVDYFRGLWPIAEADTWWINTSTGTDPGFNGDWACSVSETSVDDPALVTDQATADITHVCSRFLKSYESADFADVRFGVDTVSPKFGYYFTVDWDTVSTDDITYVEPSADTFTWQGAASTAAVLGATILATLAF